LIKVLTKSCIQPKHGILHGLSINITRYETSVGNVNTRVI